MGRHEVAGAANAAAAGLASEYLNAEDAADFVVLEAVGLRARQDRIDDLTAVLGRVL
jgi:hypothetical protein